MLRQLLSLFNNAPGPLSLELLAAQMDLEPAVLEGMLVELVRMGRLERIEDRAAVSCAACGHATGCPYVMSNAGACYTLPQTTISASPYAPGRGNPAPTTVDATW